MDGATDHQNVPMHIDFTVESYNNRITSHSAGLYPPLSNSHTITIPIDIFSMDDILTVRLYCALDILTMRYTAPAQAVRT